MRGVCVRSSYESKKQVLGLVAGEPLVVDPACHAENPERGGVDETDVMFRVLAG